MGRLLAVSLLAWLGLVFLSWAAETDSLLNAR